MRDLFKSADRLILHFNPLNGGYEVHLHLRGIPQPRSLTLGTAETAAAILQANDVRHFDYSQSLADDEYRLRQLLARCAHIDFAM